MLGLKGFSSLEQALVWGVLVVAFLGLGYAVWLRKQILALPAAGGKAREVWQAIKEGAEAYLAHQWGIIRFLLIN